MRDRQHEFELDTSKNLSGRRQPEHEVALIFSDLFLLALRRSKAILGRACER